MSGNVRNDFLPLVMMDEKREDLAHRNIWVNSDNLFITDFCGETVGLRREDFVYFAKDIGARYYRTYNRDGVPTEYSVLTGAPTLSKAKVYEQESIREGEPIGLPYTDIPAEKWESPSREEEVPTSASAEEPEPGPKVPPGEEGPKDEHSPPLTGVDYVMDQASRRDPFGPDQYGFKVTPIGPHEVHKMCGTKMPRMLHRTDGPILRPLLYTGKCAVGRIRLPPDIGEAGRPALWILNPISGKPSDLRNYLRYVGMGDDRGRDKPTTSSPA